METEKQYNNAERERNKEIKEADIDAETKIGAAKERADFLIREVKSSKKQMQNILFHMQQVTNAIRDLRAELQLATNQEDPASVRHDQARIDVLREKIKEYSSELMAMKEDLIREEMNSLEEQGFAGSLEERRARAEEIVGDWVEGI